MSDLPMAVVLSALVKDGKILLIKRKKGDYVGLLGLPGGKVEKNEHLSDAAIREILEESGIKSDFKDHLGFISEHLIENGNVLQHFLLHICELNPKTTRIINDSEGKLGWYNLSEIKLLEPKIIPSDFLIINKMIIGREKGYYNCVIEKSGDNHTLRKFERN